MPDKVVLAYSGGVDTSVAIKWLQETYDLDVIAVTIDVGNERDFSTVRQKARPTVTLAMPGATLHPIARFAITTPARPFPIMADQARAMLIRFITWSRRRTNEEGTTRPMGISGDLPVE